MDGRLRLPWGWLLGKRPIPSPEPSGAFRRNPRPYPKRERRQNITREERRNSHFILKSICRGSGKSCMSFPFSAGVSSRPARPSASLMCEANHRSLRMVSPSRIVQYSRCSKRRTAAYSPRSNAICASSRRFARVRRSASATTSQTRPTPCSACGARRTRRFRRRDSHRFRKATRRARKPPGRRRDRRRARKAGRGTAGPARCPSTPATT